MQQISLRLSSIRYAIAIAQLSLAGDKCRSVDAILAIKHFFNPQIMHRICWTLYALK